MTDVIEGTAVEVIPAERAVIPAQPGQALVTADAPDGQDRMLEAASRIATSLTRMVEQQQLYTLIQGKKYPHVEAWMTIGRMDNVVARESDRPVKNEDGSWEAFVELIRLSDGMVIGGASAMAGGKGDGNWTGRPDHVKRSMAVTRATSRAFRQQYSWIMTLAGYQPTPADEMPPDDHPGEPMRPPLERRAEGLIGDVKAGAPPVDLSLRNTADGGAVFGFKLMAGRKGFQCVAEGDLAQVLAIAVPPLTDGLRVTVFGSVESVPWTKDGKSMPPYSRIHLERIKTPEWTIPAEDVPEPVEAPSVPLFDDEEQARLDSALESVGA